MLVCGICRNIDWYMMGWGHPDLNPFNYLFYEDRAICRVSRADVNPCKDVPYIWPLASSGTACKVGWIEINGHVRDLRAEPGLVGVPQSDQISGPYKGSALSDEKSLKWKSFVLAHLPGIFHLILRWNYPMKHDNLLNIRKDPTPRRRQELSPQPYHWLDGWRSVGQEVNQAFHYSHSYSSIYITARRVVGGWLWKSPN